MKLNEVVGLEPVNQNQVDREAMVDPAWGSPVVTTKAGLPKTRPVHCLQPCGYWGQQEGKVNPGGGREAGINTAAGHFQSVDSRNKEPVRRHGATGAQSKDFMTELGRSKKWHCSE